MVMLNSGNAAPLLPTTHNTSPHLTLRPEIRVISVGSGGWKLLEDHYFNTYMYPPLDIGPDQLLFIGRTGRLRHAPRSTDQDPLHWDFHMEGECCERDLVRLADFRNALMEARSEILQFVQPAHWIILVASLDNGMAFATCDEIAKLCRTVSTKLLGMIATPYTKIPMDPVRRAHLSNASEAVIKTLTDNGHPVIFDSGMWAGAGYATPISWSWHHQDVALGMITQLSKEGAFGQFENMIQPPSRLHCAHGLNDTAAKAIQDAIDSSHDWEDIFDGKRLTAAGAVIRVSGHPNTIDALCAIVRGELRQPDKFHRNGQPYWREHAQFIVMAEPCAHAKAETYFSLDILSTGVEVS